MHLEKLKTPDGMSNIQAQCLKGIMGMLRVEALEESSKS